MSVNLPESWKSSKVRAVEFMTAYPSAHIKEVAEEAGVTKNTVHLWLRDPEFVEVFYQKYMVSFGSKLPSILNAMIREAEAGNVQAGRLILEHSGKLIKRVEVNNYQSPFEKFLGNKDSKDYKDEKIEEAEFTVMPERPIVQKKKKPKTKVQELREIKVKKDALQKRSEAAKWRRRAIKVGVELLPRGRKTKLMLQSWQTKVIEAENNLKTQV